MSHNYFEIKPIADRIVQILDPHCDRIHIAGSIRRERQEVGDIEIVCQPKKEFVQTDLFGGGHIQIVKGFTDGLAMITKETIKGEPTGRMMQIQLKGKAKIMLDLFMPEPRDYFRQYAIRTGSAKFSGEVIARAWRRRGWVGTENAGLRQEIHCIQTKSGWKCLNLNSDLPPDWQSEEEFFNWLEIPYVEPRNRNL